MARRYPEPPPPGWPPWDVPGQYDPERMFRMVVKTLEEEELREDPARHVVLVQTLKDWNDHRALTEQIANSAPEKAAIRAAWQGNIEMLRRLHPHLAPFLHAPKRPRGKHVRPQPSRREEFIQYAAEDVPRIRKIWRELYDQRNRTTKPTTVEIAAWRWDVGTDDVVRYMRRGKKKPKPRGG